MVNYLHLGNFSAGKTHKNNGVALLRFRDKVENNPFGDFGPCSWFGIECSQGHVISLLLSNETAAVSTQNKEKSMGLTLPPERKCKVT
ncbi:uncharacterized protein LOC141678908 isoform X2 [Apium graveolens]|uniref:uncharacterized protein LOC141678908 isoform X2 n=1 Tax=Apium graveolens TaxID=4045 RepID=UPI003D78D018